MHLQSADLPFPLFMSPVQLFLPIWGLRRADPGGSGRNLTFTFVWYRDSRRQASHHSPFLAAGQARWHAPHHHRSQVWVARGETRAAAARSPGPSCVSSSDPHPSLSRGNTFWHAQWDKRRTTSCPRTRRPRPRPATKTTSLSSLMGRPARRHWRTCLLNTGRYMTGPWQTWGRRSSNASRGPAMEGSGASAPLNALLTGSTSPCRQKNVAELSAKRWTIWSATPFSGKLRSSSTPWTTSWLVLSEAFWPVNTSKTPAQW